MTASKQSLSRLPSMTALLQAAASRQAFRDLPQSVVTDALREALDDVRSRLKTAQADPAAADLDAVLSSALSLIASQRVTRLARVINATGIVLHTGLGRSVLPAAAVQRITDVAAGYCSLEINLESGKRGRRGAYAESLLCRITGAEAAMIVNNNAAATMMALHGLAQGKEVIVSRGQLIEIGGSFRLPEVMAGGGAVLREVGTTNKTHIRDYEAAVCDKTALIMHVHTSNYRVVGFAESPGAVELAELAHRHGLPMLDDLGSGAIFDDDLWARADEPTVAASGRHGADLITFSGDKLLGGPQAGILLGRRAVIDKLRSNPMARALRVDKLTVAALEATLELYQSPETVKEQVPLLASLSEPIESLTARAGELAERLQTAMPGERFIVQDDESFAGGGTLPARPMPTAVVRWQPASCTTDVENLRALRRNLWHRRPAGGATGETPVPHFGCDRRPRCVSLDEITRRLRTGEPGVLPRIREGAILFDLRTVGEHEYDPLVAAIAAVAGTRPETRNDA